jgi:hypothetical protein
MRNVITYYNMLCDILHMRGLPAYYSQLHTALSRAIIFEIHNRLAACLSLHSDVCPACQLQAQGGPVIFQAMCALFMQIQGTVCCLVLDAVAVTVS